MHTIDEVDELLKARAEIDEQLRRHKGAVTVLFTDVVGSTSYFERNGDTAGLVMIHRHDELAARAIQQHDGKVIKTIGDSAMAEFPDPASAVRAAIQIERQFLQLNLTLPEDQRVQVRIGVHTGVGFRKGNDLFGDVVNVTARIVKRTAPAQILISRAMYELISDEPDLHFRWLNKLTMDGRAEKEDIYEVVWTDLEAYQDVQDRMSAACQFPPRYEVLGQIGMGGTGIVYKVRDLETGETVALKVLKPEIASDPNVQENLKRELCLARKITHKNVCRTHEFSRSNGMAYTSMELVEGESLSSRLARTGALPLNEVLDIARQICAGLREAHAQGIVHRDLKPANIMLDRSGTVKIMDFGIARLIEHDAPMTGTIVGTPAYMSPEQAELKPVSSCTDIYALGLVLYEMITGTAAFDGDTPVAVALKQIRDYPKRPREIVPSISSALDAVTMKCLQKDPAKRFQSASELDVALLHAAKARRGGSWEAAVERGLVQAERELRKNLRPVINEAANLVERYVEKQRRQPLLRSQEEPKAMLGVTGMAAAVAVFLMFGVWKPTTTNAQIVHVPTQNPAISLANASLTDLKTLPATNSSAGVSSTENESSGDHLAGGLKKLSSDSGDSNSLKSILASRQAAPPVVPSKLTPTAKPMKSQVPGRKAHVQAPSALQLVATTELPLPAASPAVIRELPATSAEPEEAREPVVVQAKAANQPKNNAGGKMYIEVGSFKDETWANNAVDKLSQLGFHAVVLHKNVLWSQSYHVQVGPYADPVEIAEARQSLASQGFKGHPVN